MNIIAAIKDATSRHFGVSRYDIASPKRHARVAHPRQVAMHICRIMTPASLPEIGRHFGRDHTTVIHALAAVHSRMDAELSHDIRQIMDAVDEETSGADMWVQHVPFRSRRVIQPKFHTTRKAA